MRVESQWDLGLRYQMGIAATLKWKSQNFAHNNGITL